MVPVSTAGLLHNRPAKLGFPATFLPHHRRPSCMLHRRGLRRCSVPILPEPEPGSGTPSRARLGNAVTALKAYGWASSTRSPCPPRPQILLSQGTAHLSTVASSADRSASVSKIKNVKTSSHFNTDISLTSRLDSYLETIPTSIAASYNKYWAKLVPL